MPRTTQAPAPGYPPARPTAQTPPPLPPMPATIGISTASATSWLIDASNTEITVAEISAVLARRARALRPAIGLVFATGDASALTPPERSTPPNATPHEFWAVALDTKCE